MVYYLDSAESRGRIGSVASKQCLYQLYIPEVIRKESIIYQYTYPFDKESMVKLQSWKLHNLTRYSIT